MSFSPDQLIQQSVGSTDWAGGLAPSAGTHTGISTITMVDGASFLVAHSRAEALLKCDPHAVASETPMWVAFDQPGSALPVILDIQRIQSIA